MQLSSDIVRTDFTTLATNIRSVASDGTTAEPAKVHIYDIDGFSEDSMGQGFSSARCSYL